MESASCFGCSVALKELLSDSMSQNESRDRDGVRKRGKRECKEKRGEVCEEKRMGSHST